MMTRLLIHSKVRSSHWFMSSSCIYVEQRNASQRRRRLKSLISSLLVFSEHNCRPLSHKCQLTSTLSQVVCMEQLLTKRFPTASFQLSAFSQIKSGQLSITFGRYQEFADIAVARKNGKGIRCALRSRGWA